MKDLSIRRMLKLARVASTDPKLAIDAASIFGWLESKAIKRFSYRDKHLHEIEFPGGIYDGIWHSKSRRFPESCDLDDLYPHLERALSSTKFQIEYVLNSKKHHQITIFVNDDSCSIQEKLGYSVIKASGISHNRHLCISSLLCIGHIPTWINIVNDKNH
ncbi:hypothetical protein [Comamonas testosteroni]|uniref:hypothetical protein n=1 Tax=Comamonas testosteroni TaxID=285 RepID=UPI00391D6BD1